MTDSPTPAEFEALWASKLPDEHLPVHWQKELAPFIHAGLTRAQLQDAVQIAATRKLDDARLARSNPRFRYLMGVLRNQSAAGATRQAKAGAPETTPQLLKAILVELRAIRELLEVQPLDQ